MFFLGLAGSFMPYLLLLGALFVLTLNVNIQPDDETVVITEKTIEYQSIENQNIKNSCSNFIYHSHEANATDHSNTQTAFVYDDQDLIFQSREKTQHVTTPQNYSLDVFHTFFGLSPPVLIS